MPIRDLRTGKTYRNRLDYAFSKYVDSINRGIELLEDVPNPFRSGARILGLAATPLMILQYVPRSFNKRYVKKA